MKASRSCDPELYSRIKDAVSMQQAVEYCGLHILTENASVRSIRIPILP